MKKTLAMKNAEHIDYCNYISVMTAQLHSYYMKGWCFDKDEGWIAKPDGSTSLLMMKLMVVFSSELGETGVLYMVLDVVFVLYS